MRLEYVPYLRDHLLQMFSAGESASSIDAVIACLDHYGLSKDDFMETLKELQIVRDGDPTLKDRFESLDSKLKAALTRAYNA